MVDVGVRAAPRRAAPAVRVMLALVFGVSLIGKLLDWPALVVSVSASGWVPRGLASAAAVLVLVTEAAATVFLLTRRGMSLGAMLSLLLGALFLGVTTTKMLHGVGGDCACFGLLFHTPPQVTLLIDLGLVLGSSYLLRPILRQLRLRLPAAPPEAPAVPRPAVWSLGASFLVVALAAGAMVAGPWVPRQRVEPVIPLRYGRTAPAVAQASAERWRILLFADPDCTACGPELAEVEALVQRHSRRLDAGVIVPRRPLLPVHEPRAAERIRRRLHTSLPVTLDPDYALTRAYCDQPLRLPFSVLIDPKRRVRWAQIGHVDGDGGMSAAVGHLAAGEPVQRTEEFWGRDLRGTRLPEVPVAIHGRPVPLRAAVPGRALLVYANRTCPSCERLVRHLVRMEDYLQEIQVLVIAPSERTAELWRTVGQGRLPVAFDHDLRAAQALGASVLPTVVLAEEGVIVENWRGPGHELRVWDAVTRRVVPGAESGA